MDSLVCAIQDGYTVVLQGHADRDGALCITHREIHDNGLDLSLARHGHLRPEAREAVERQLRPLALRTTKGSGPVMVLLGSALGGTPRLRAEREAWVRALQNQMGYAVNCLEEEEEGHLLGRAHGLCFPGEEHHYLLQLGGWQGLLVRELGQGAGCNTLPWGCERPGLFEGAGRLRENALPELGELLRGHLKTLDLTGQPAWLLGAVAARLTFGDDRRLAACTLDARGLADLRDWLGRFDAPQRETLPLLAGRGHTIIDALALAESVMQTRGFSRLRFCPWSAAHTFLLDHLQ